MVGCSDPDSFEKFEWYKTVDMSPSLGPNTLPCNMRMTHGSKFDPTKNGVSVVPDLFGPVAVLVSVHKPAHTIFAQICTDLHELCTNLCKVYSRMPFPSRFHRFHGPKVLALVATQHVLVLCLACPPQDNKHETLSVVNVSVLLAAEQHKHPHDAIFLANGDIVVATWAPVPPPHPN